MKDEIQSRAQEIANNVRRKEKEKKKKNSAGDLCNLYQSELDVIAQKLNCK